MMPMSLQLSARTGLSARPSRHQSLRQGRVSAATRPARSSVRMMASSSKEDPTDSPVLKFVNWLGNSLNASKLNEGKIKVAVWQAGEYEEDAIRKQMEGMIDGNKVMVFSFSTCPFCIKAKNLLDDMGVEYTAAELDLQGKEGYAIRAELAKKTGRTSMPNIFIAGEGIGGCNDGPGIMTLQKNGELLPKLEAAKAV